MTQKQNENKLKADLIWADRMVTVGPSTISQVTLSDISFGVLTSVTRLDDLLDFRQLFKALGHN